MNMAVGYIPYLNMTPFHYGFGPTPLNVAAHRLSFKLVSPATLGHEAARGNVDAGAMSLVDTFRLESEFELLGNYGIGVKRAAQSVLLFSKYPIEELQGICGVTDETATSVRLLSVLLEKRYNNRHVHFGRIGSAKLIDDSLEAVLLIGDDALQYAKEGISGLPVITDLAEEWFQWQSIPFVFARWVIRRSTPTELKNILPGYLDRSLKQTEKNILMRSAEEANAHHMTAAEIQSYWEGFDYRLSAAHQLSIKRFQELNAKCLI